MEFGTFFLGLFILLATHTLAIIFVASSRSKHFISKIYYARTYVINNQLKVRNIFFNKLLKTYQVFVRYIAILLFFNLSLYVLMSLSAAIDPNTGKLLNPFRSKLFIIFFAINILFSIADFTGLAWIILTKRKIKEWIKFNNSTKAKVHFESLLNFKETKIVYEQVDPIAKNYLFQYDKLSFNNTMDYLKEKNLSNYIYYWLIQDFSHLKINNKQANINMFLFAYSKYVRSNDDY